MTTTYPRSMYATGHVEIKRLRAGEVIEFEGAKLRMVAGKESGCDLVPGDMYFAQRNTSHVFIAKNHNEEGGWVMPEDRGYPFNCGECVGVEFA